MFVADMANQAIMARPIEEKEGETTPELVKDFEGSPLLGPNSLACSTILSKFDWNLLEFIGNILISLDSLFFTDSGPFGETSIENPKGSVFMIDLDGQFIRPLALNCLAYPSGIALSLDEKIIYVSETCKNRVLRFVLSSQGIYFFR